MKINCKRCNREIEQKEIDSPLCSDYQICDDCAAEIAPYCPECEENIYPFLYPEKGKQCECECGQEFVVNCGAWVEEI